MKYALGEEQSTLRTSPLLSCSVQHLKSDEALDEELEEVDLELGLELEVELPLEKIDDTRRKDAPIKRISGAGWRNGFLPGNKGISKGTATRISLNDGDFILSTTISFIKSETTK